MSRYLLPVLAALSLSVAAPATAEDANGFPTDDCDEYGCVTCWEEDANNFMCDHISWLEIGLSELWHPETASTDLTTNWQPPEPPMAPILLRPRPATEPTHMPRRPR